MTKYIALLRGVNVGGNNKISMSELKGSFERQGFENVVTYSSAKQSCIQPNYNSQCEYGAEISRARREDTAMIYYVYEDALHEDIS